MYGIHLRADSAMHWYIGPASTQCMEICSQTIETSISRFMFYLFQNLSCISVPFLFTMQLRITCVLFEFPLDINLFDWTDGERKS